MKPSEYFQLLKAHDWYYMFSDDSRVYKKGDANSKKLLSLAGGDESLLALYDAYRKQVFENGPKVEQPGE